jgi:transposase
VFGLGLATKIYVAVEAVDMRKGFEGLYGLVRDQLGADPLSGHLFLFSNRTRTRLKALVWDAAGYGCAPSGWRKAASVGRKRKKNSAA